jgi:hypothetical protein
MIDKTNLVKAGSYTRIVGILIVLAAFPLDEGILFAIGFIVIFLGHGMRIYGSRM